MDKTKNIEEMLVEAKRRVDAMTPEQRAAMEKAQRESFMRGMGPCEHGILDFEDCEECRAKAKHHG